MSKVLDSSTLTDRYQTTIPEPVRKALHLNKRDKIEYSITANGNIILSRADENDPVLGTFLTFIANDIQQHPQHVKSISSELYTRAKLLVADIDIDLDAPLSDKDE